MMRMTAIFSFVALRGDHPFSHAWRKFVIRPGTVPPYGWIPVVIGYLDSLLVAVRHLIRSYFPPGFDDRVRWHLVHSLTALVYSVVSRIPPHMAA